MSNERILRSITQTQEDNLTFYFHTISLFLSVFKTSQLVPGGRTERAVPRSATVFKNIPPPVTPKREAVSARLRIMAHDVNKV